MKKHVENNLKGGTKIGLLEFQQAQLQKLEFAEPISEETEQLLKLVLAFLFDAQELKSKPLLKRQEVYRKLVLLRNKMSLLNKVSATGKELLMEEVIC